MGKFIGKAITAIVAILLCIFLAIVLPQAQAQSPSPDAYEENDTLVSASSIPRSVTLTSLTISPANDPDYFRFIAVPGPLRAEAIGTPGLDLTIEIIDGNGAVIASNNDPASPNARVTLIVPAEQYYAVHISNGTAFEGFYELRLFNEQPTPTPTIVPTSTPLPTATNPFPTNTPTPDQGGPPDYAEPNFDFSTAYRIVPGDRLENLNFNPGMPGEKDNDFFVMAVRAGITYTCQTEDLGPSVDTNLIVYNSADFNDVAGGNDDQNTQAGQINSQLQFIARAEGDVYILVGYKYPRTEDIRYTGNATYTLTCLTSSPTPTQAAQSGGGASSSGSAPAQAQKATPLSIQVLEQPQTTPTATPPPVGTITIDILVAYDANANKTVDAAEGTVGLSVRVLDAISNRELTHGYTDTTGAVRFVVATNGAVRVVIPFLNAAHDFRPGSPVTWTLLIPPSNIPGLIP